MTYRVQIITAKGEPVIDARVWEEPGIAAVQRIASGVTRVKRIGETRWRYTIAGQSNKPTNQMREAFRLAGMFDQREK